VFAQTIHFTSVIIFLCLAFLGLAIFLIYIVYKNNLTNIHRRSELLHAMLKAQEGERERLAMDLHDGLGSKISALRLEHEAFSGKIGNEHAAKSNQLLELIEEIRQDVRIISKNLVPYDLQRYGLMYELDKLQYNIETVYGKRFIYKIKNMEQRLPYFAELNIFRMLQELVNNTVKHSGASEINLSIINDNKSIAIHYQDDGKGLMHEHKKEGIGLSNINTRAEHLNGNVHFKENNGHGFDAYITIPLAGLHYL